MADLWTIFCGQTECSHNNGKPCGPDFVLVTHPTSCINHALLVLFDILLLVMFLFNVVYKRSNKSTNRPRGISRLQFSSALFNGLLGLGCLCLAIYIFEEYWRTKQTVLPMHWWLLLLFHGVIWLIVSLTVSLQGTKLLKGPLRLLSVLALLFSGVSFGLSVFSLIFNDEEASIKIALDALYFVGASILMCCTYKGFNYQENDDNGSDHYTPLNNESEADSGDNVTPFEKAGVFSKMSFWWLNPLMKRGKEKTLVDEDIPKLRETDRAEACYLQFLDRFNKQKARDASSQPSILRTIISCHMKEILISGLYAILKVTTISAGPVILNAFVNVAEGNGSFKYEGYVLPILLFFSKNVESLSQRQWYFLTRLIGVKVRLLLTAAIYKKQLRLSNAAKATHSAGEIMNYVTVDAYRIGEFPYWFHQLWATSLQLCFALIILYRAVGLATIASLTVIILTVACNAPLAKLQHKYQTKLMVAQDARLKACSEALISMKVLKLYAWESHFKSAIEKLRTVEYKWLEAVQFRRACNSLLFWASPVLVSTATFATCYFLGIPLRASNVFTFVATLRLVQDPIRFIPEAIMVVIQAKVAFARIVNFLEAPELKRSKSRQKWNKQNPNCSILIKAANFSWDENSLKPTLRNIKLEVGVGEKVAICGEVGSGKSTLLAAILGEVPNVRGTVEVYGSIAYVSQSAWIQTGSIRENILFGSDMDVDRYHATLDKCSLTKDLELLPYGDLTEIGERGVNLSGGQKQRVQLARALYQDADLYLLDDPFSAVDAHTATSLFNDYVMDALSRKTVLLVTHQVDFLPAFDSVLLMSDGQILHAAPYNQLMASRREFRELVEAHKETAGSERLTEINASRMPESLSRDTIKPCTVKMSKEPVGEQLIKTEEREVGDAGLKPYVQYLSQNKGFLLFSILLFSQLAFVVGQVLQNSWMAANVENPDVSPLRLIIVYMLIGFLSVAFLTSRFVATVFMGMNSSRAIFSQLLTSLFRAPVSFYDSTPLGRILSRVSTDLNIVDFDLPFSITLSVGATSNTYANLVVLAVVTWQVLFVSVPMVYLAIRLQQYYFASAKELMRINGTTKSVVASHLAESVQGAMTIRAFEEEDRFFSKNLDLIDKNASPFFLNFAAIEWLTQRLETLSATVLSASALCMALLPTDTFSSGFIGMALTYGLSLNTSFVFSINNQCLLANYVISMERLKQYMDIPSEAPEVIEDNRPPVNWPVVGKVEIQDLQIRYRPDAPLVLRGISCTFEGGHKIGIVGRTGSGKTTLIGALFRLVEPTGGKIVVDGIDISTIGLHDLRSRFGIIPQDPTLFNGTVRYNLDPLSRHTDQELWEVLAKCQLKETVEDKEVGLDSLVVDDGLNWSMGQRQLFCLGRALLRRSKVLVLDEATASIDNATDLILQRTIRTEFVNSTVITVAHRIPTVMDCNMVLAIKDGQVVEYDEPMKLMKTEGSLFGELVKEYWSHSQSAESR